MIRSRRTPVVVLVALSATVTSLSAQAPLLERGSVGIAPEFTSWSIVGGGLPQATLDGLSTVPVTAVSQWSIPVRAAVAIGPTWMIDATAAYANTHVSLGARDTSLNTTHYDVSGLTDVRVRATGHLVGDNVVVTFGVNAPTGETSLRPAQLDALRVASAPALAFGVPILGLGPAGTAGLVLARQIAGWAWGIGGTFEYRGSYTPVSEVAGLGAPNFSPADVVHLSAGTDGLIGQSAMSLTASLDLFGTNRLTTAPTSVGGTPIPGLAVGTRLGPIVTASWQLRLPPSGIRDLTLFAVERYRTNYTSEGVTVPRSSGHYIDAGVAGAIPTTLNTALETALFFRYQTGLASDSGVATAGTRAAGIRLGFADHISRTLALTPFVRGELGNLSTAGYTRPAYGFSGGVALTQRF